MIITEDTELGWLWIPLHNEIIAIDKCTNDNKPNEYNRIYVRSLFSLIEGITYHIRQVLIERNNKKQIRLKPEEILILEEKSLEIEQNGKFKKKDRFYRFEDIFCFTFSLYSNYYNKQEILQKHISNNRYSDFKDSIKIRNRVTHPKSSKDLFVKGDDIKKVKTTHDWFYDLMHELFLDDLLIDKKH